MTRYSAEQLDFLEHGYKLWSYQLLTLFFNAWFETNRTVMQIRSTIRNHRFTCGRRPGFDKGTFLSYTLEQVEFIKVGYRTMTLCELTAAFNEKFDTSKKVSQLKAFTNNHKVLSGRTGCFEKGSKPWNTGTKGQGLTGPNSGSFKKGQAPSNRKPLGSERICSKEGYVLIKVAETNPHTGFPTRWRAKHVVNWEDENGKVPDGFILRFKDGDKRNCDPENMELITRSEHVRLNQMGYNDLPEELKPPVRIIAKIKTKVGRLRSKQEGKSCHTQ